MPIKPRIQHLSPRNKLARALWTGVWLLLHRPSPTLLHGWRRLLLRLFGAKIGRGAHPYPSAKIWAPWNLTMGEHSCPGHQVDCYSVDKITLGAHSTVSQYSFLCTASHDYTDPAMPLATAPITLGERVWVTADVFVAPGVTIRDGAVIAARSSVFHDIEPWMVAGGNPAQPPNPAGSIRPPPRPGAPRSMDTIDLSGYRYAASELNCSHDYLLPAVFRLLDGLNLPAGQRRLFELGCGNGSVARELARRGWNVTGVDPSLEGIAQAQRAHPELQLHSGSAYDDLAAQYGQFPVVLSLEVVEHVYFPRQYAATVFSLLQGGYGHPVDALSRGLEKPGAGGYRQDGYALHRPVGSRPHQVLVDENTHSPARRSRVPRHSV